LEKALIEMEPSPSAQKGRKHAARNYGAPPPALQQSYPRKNASVILRPPEDAP